MVDMFVNKVTKQTNYHVHIHRWHPPWSGIRQAGGPHSRPQSLMSLQARVCHTPPEVSPCPVSGDAQVILGLWSTLTRGWSFLPLARTETIVHAAQGLLGLIQVSAVCLRQVTGLLASCHALVHLCMIRLHPLTILLRDHFTWGWIALPSWSPCHLQWSGKPWNSGNSLGTSVPRRPSSTSPTHSRPHHGHIQL